MFHVQSVFDIAAYRKCRRRLRRIERSFAENSWNAAESASSYKNEMLYGLELVERFLPRMCSKSGSRTAALMIKKRDLSSNQPLFDLDAGREAFRTIATAAQRAEAKIFPISGTLLGLIREGDLLAHDYDLDFGIMNEDRAGYWRFFEILQGDPSLSSINYYWPNQITTYLNPELRNGTNIPLMTKMKFRNGIAIDLGNHFPIEGRRVHGSAYQMWKHDDFDLIESHRLEVDIYVPSVPEKYLEENYGDWITPVIDYIYFLDTPNWQPAIAVNSMHLYVKKALQYCATGNYHRVMRVVDELIPKFRSRLIDHHPQ